MSRERGQLDPRAWLLWAAAAGLPPLLGRNPVVLVAVLLACLGVRGAVMPETAASASWGWIIRLAGLFAIIGAVFNLLTVHIGDQQMASLPESIPIVGGPLTWNALVYGFLSGLAILILVIIGVTLAACLDHAELLRMLPGRLTTVAVAGSVALAFLPQTVTAFHEIREAQAARGYRLRGARGLVPLIVPLLTGGLERALTLAEALEARGFGAPREERAPLTVPAAGGHNSSNRWRSIATTLSLTALAAGGYLLAVGDARIGIATLGLGIVAFMLAGREAPHRQHRRTRYRQTAWTWRESTVAAAALVTLAAELIILKRDPAAFQYQPYPNFAAPSINLWLLIALALLLAPAVVAAAAPETAGCDEDIRP